MTELKKDAMTFHAPPSTLFLTTTPRPGHPARAKIEKLDLEPIKYKLVKEHAWTLEKADSVEKLYKTYLLLFALHPGEMHVPTRDIDEMWHSHILDTRKYMEDCHDIFGYYLHHYPYLGLTGAEDAEQAEEKFTATRRFFIAESGIDPAGHLAADCGGGCGGGGGCSSSSCSGGSDHGGGADHGHGDSGYVPPSIISSCSSGSPLSRKTPLRDAWEKKDRKTPANDSGGAPKKKPFWKRIIGFTRRENEDVSAPPSDLWLRSVTPRARLERRPGRAELLDLAATYLPEDATRH